MAGGRPRKISAADMLDLDVKGFLRGAIGKFGSAENFGEQFADLCIKENENGMPTGVADSVRMNGMKMIAQLLGQFGSEGSENSLADPDAIDALIARHEASKPAMEAGGFEDDDESE